jgi:cytochrome c peroxidase
MPGDFSQEPPVPREAAQFGRNKRNTRFLLSKGKNGYLWAPLGVAALFLGVLLLGAPGSSRAAADADVPLDVSGQPTWARHAAEQARRVLMMPDRARRMPDRTTEPTPPVLPEFETFPNQDGRSANFQPNGDTQTALQAFFAPLGTNARTCQTCHQPAAGWTITPTQIQAAFQETGGRAPLFNPLDGAVCPDADVSTDDKRLQAYRLVLQKGLIRIFIKLPDAPTLQFSVTSVQDPYGCNTGAAFGLSSFGPSAPTQGTVSVYRRPLPSTNLPFSTSLMWDGREPSLQSQAIDAALIHSQADASPTAAQLDQIVAFETGLFSAQDSGAKIGPLTESGAQGGPRALSEQPFYIGINDPLGGNPKSAPFNPDTITLYSAWESQELATSENQAAIARGEKLFNEKPITITGVAGLNDKPGLATVKGSCSTCHDTPNVGNHSLPLPINIGVVAPSATGLDTTGLPVFTIRCDAGPLAGQIFQVTDPGKALISGQCADIGKTKGPVLRNLAARPPYFHNGAAPDLRHVTDFYNTRFGIGFTDKEKSDLIAFLKSL